MKFILTTIATGALALSLSAMPAAAGNTQMKHADGSKVRINCKDSGCRVTQKPVGQKWGVIENTVGGVDTFKALKAKYQGLGYK